jgi:hypothetical protein
MRRPAFKIVALSGVVMHAGACNPDDGKPEGPEVILPAPTASGTSAGNPGDNCGVDADCKTGHCFVGGKQSFCSVPCTPNDYAQVCPAPINGSCNMMGFCKAP